MNNLTNDFSDVNIRVYSAGGAGINVISELDAIRSEPAHGFATMLPCYIDTSASNIRSKKLPEDAVYTFDGMDGSGKVRSTNYEDVSKNAKAILLKYKPTAFNIVVHSGSGGSGSIIAPILVSELKARGHQVIVLLIGSTDTRIEIENTIKTLKSYESIADKRNSPVVVYYAENTQHQSRFEVNRMVKHAIGLLMGLFSGQNSELDTADLKNWLEYTNITKTQARLASLTFAVTKEELSDAGTVISVATLAMPEVDTRVEQTPAYQCVGYAPACWRTGAPNSLQLLGDSPIHFCISDDFITRANDKLTQQLREVDDIFNSRNARNSILDKGDARTEHGVVL